ncbi:MAG TPA: hypothetical protein VGV61_08200, partial [Thermoanaerobaculia bacterium]|nr:hypothetical protein [Thermoanaerobaculia bacterium]
MNPSPPPAAGSRSEATPILDRVTPLPPLQTAPAERTLAWMLAAAGVTAAILLGAFGHARAIRGWVLAHVALWFPGPWTVTRAVGVIASVIVVSFTVVAIHEIGHVLAGLAAGFRFH